MGYDMSEKENPRLSSYFPQIPGLQPAGWSELEPPSRLTPQTVKDIVPE